MTGARVTWLPVRSIRLFLGLLAVVVGWALVVAWAASYWVRPALSRQTETGTLGAFAYKGSVAVWVNGYPRPGPPGATWDADAPPIERLGVDEDDWFPQTTFLNRLGFYFRDLRDRGRRYSAAADRCWIAPIWFVVVALWAWPAIGVARAVRQARRARPGVCVRCGYDLRASPQQCPECGWAIRADAPESAD